MNLPLLALALVACDVPTVDPDDSSDSSDTTDLLDSAVGPTAVATADPTVGLAPLDVTLSSAGSSAGSQPIESFAWSLSDGSELTGETVTTTLLDLGGHSFTLTVVDEDGRSDEASVQVQVQQEAEGDCPEVAEAAVAGTMSWGEVSGLASSATDGILWGHSDAQGAGAVVYAISTSAVLQGTFTLAGVNDYDFEDIARGPGPEAGVSYIYVGDTGDNSERRSSIQIHRFAEPSDLSGGTITGVETIDLTYPDGPRDCETLIVDPLSGDLILVERDRADQGVSGIYVAGAPLSTTGSTELTKVGTLVFGTDPMPGDVDAVGGDVSPDGTLVVVRTHDRVWAFVRDPDQALYTAFDTPVCETPEVDESKGEAIAYALDGSGYYTGGEGSNQPLHWFGAH